MAKRTLAPWGGGGGRVRGFRGFKGFRGFRCLGGQEVLGSRGLGLCFASHMFRGLVGLGFFRGFRVFSASHLARTSPR